MVNALLATKFYIPPPPALPVPRPRLLERLDAGLASALTLVSALAGFGKTTLVSEWHHAADRRSHPLAWLSLDEDDNDPHRFLDYLIAAVATLQRRIGDTALTLLHSPQPRPPTVLLAALINDLSVLSSPFAFVLDDYHVITAQPIHELVSYLLDHRPPRCTSSSSPARILHCRSRDCAPAVIGRAARQRSPREEAEAFLRHAMALAQPQGYLRVFLDEGEAIFRLIEIHRIEIKPANLQTYVAKLLTGLGAHVLTQPRSGISTSQSAVALA